MILFTILFYIQLHILKSLCQLMKPIKELKHIHYNNMFQFLSILYEKKALITECFFLTSNYLSSQAVSSQVLSTYMGLTTVFGMGTGGTP